MLDAIVLVAGGLDSLLLAKLVQKHHIRHRLVHFDFGVTNNKPIIAGQRISKYFGLENIIRNGFELDKVDVSKEFYSSILSQHNFETMKNICFMQRIFLLQKAKEYMLQNEANLIIIGDVVEQRPTIQGLEIIKKSDLQAEIDHCVYRPLSASFLESTKIQNQYPILKNMSYDFKGFDSRREKLAKELGLIYTEVGKKLRDNPEKAMGEKVFELYDKNFINPINLHRVGIHFKISNIIRAVFAQTPFESTYLKKFYEHLPRNKKGLSFQTKNHTHFGFVYGKNIQNQNEELIASLFCYSMNQKEETFFLYDQENFLLGKKNFTICSETTYKKHLFSINNLFCPIIPN